MDSQAAMDWCCLSAWPAHAVLVTQAETSQVSGSVHRMEDRLMVNMGFKCKDISKITKFKEMLDGRVKTINPSIYSSLLYKRENEFHKKQFLSLKIPEIDIVIVNLYPFHKYLKKKGTNDIVDMIDIGGPSLLRASAKNFKYITPIIDKKDYKKLISNLKKNDGKTDLSFRKKMAGKIYKATSSYDKIIFNWFNDK